MVNQLGGPLGDATMGLLLDYYPWAGDDFTLDVENNELDELWPDPNEQGMLSHGGLWQDWLPNEGALVWWNLTEILTTSAVDITDIRVRLTDGAQEPNGGYEGNWIRNNRGQSPIY